MICGASIAKRDGTHRRCLLPPDHTDDCSPVAIARPPAPAPRRPPRGEFAWFALAHLVGVVVIVLLCCLAGCSHSMSESTEKMLAAAVCFALGYVAAAVASWLNRRRR